nr:uncharacterized protein LOC105859778 isoform X2 [Microcebus murinus]XP_012599367.1 uncharacterized protein LOC105859778 isoform X2 [Microcebus murinus]XP_012599368.1 uncharacterized protein LOC105859778 isoform X2 [Microcebus murinus]XP_012599369.1 uncharacterized protein LOC105859778 isoform X2 [Microcebus murinus]
MYPAQKGQRGLSSHPKVLPEAAAWKHAEHGALLGKEGSGNRLPLKTIRPDLPLPKLKMDEQYAMSLKMENRISTAKVTPERPYTLWDPDKGSKHQPEKGVDFNVCNVTFMSLLNLKLSTAKQVDTFSSGSETMKIQAVWNEASFRDNILLKWRVICVCLSHTQEAGDPRITAPQRPRRAKRQLWENERSMQSA